MFHHQKALQGLNQAISAQGNQALQIIAARIHQLITTIRKVQIIIAAKIHPIIIVMEDHHFILFHSSSHSEDIVMDIQV